MKKSFKYLVVITFVFSLSSCSKNEPIQKMSNNEKIQLATLSIIQDNNVWKKKRKTRIKQLKSMENGI